MTDRCDVKAQGSAVLSQQLNVQEEMRTRHLRKFRCTGGGMRCDVVLLLLLLLKRKEVNYLLVGGLFTLARRSFTRSEKEPCQVQRYHLLTRQNENSMARGPFSEKEVYCSEVGEKEKQASIIFQREWNNKIHWVEGLIEVLSYVVMTDL